MKLFYENLQNSITRLPNNEAYEATENEFIKSEGKRRFSNYRVFRVYKCRNKNLR